MPSAINRGRSPRLLWRHPSSERKRPKSCFVREPTALRLRSPRQSARTGGWKEVRPWRSTRSRSPRFSLPAAPVSCFRYKAVKVVRDRPRCSPLQPVRTCGWKEVQTLGRQRRVALPGPLRSAAPVSRLCHCQITPATTGSFRRSSVSRTRCAAPKTPALSPSIGFRITSRGRGWNTRSKTASLPVV